MQSLVETITVGVLLILSAPVLNGKGENEIGTEKSMQVLIPSKDSIHIEIERNQGKKFEDQPEFTGKGNQGFKPKQQRRKHKQDKPEEDFKQTLITARDLFQIKEERNRGEKFKDQPQIKKREEEGTKHTEQFVKDAQQNRESKLKYQSPKSVKKDDEKTTEKETKNQIQLEMVENWGTDSGRDWEMQTRDIWRSNKKSTKNVNFPNVLPNSLSRLVGSFKVPDSIFDGLSKSKTMVSNIFKTLVEFCEKKIGSEKGQPSVFRKSSSAMLEHSGSRSPSSGLKFTKHQSNSPEGQKLDEFSAADMIENIHIIPGSGEFVYDTKIQKKRGISSSTYNYEKPMNQNNNAGKSDAILSLENLQRDLPNVRWVSVVVSWFANNINIKDCQIYPAVEFKNDFTVIPDDWQVGKISRANARLVSRDENGNPRYGGTISDAALIRFIGELHRRGYSVMLYPMIFLDTDNKEWRGRLTGPPSSISAFFSGQYNGFIRHYCNIAKQTRVEGFIIGSEFEELTKIKDLRGNYPAVVELVKLAKEVKTQLGREVTVTYAANWSEYHSYGGWYNMDALWSSEYIDVVGIDAYFPLIDGPEPPDGYSVQNVIDGWSSGEGYDYFFDYSKSRPEKVKYEDSKWAWKNIEKWWSEAHFNPNGSPTKWQPKMKKVWFTEYGFPSVDACANEPYLFVDGSSRESKYPRYSNKEVSFRSQSIAIEGTIKKWRNSEMVEKMFLWTWDARPFPYFPNLQDVWGDCKNWKTGHWIQGKIGKVTRSDRKPTASDRRGVKSPKNSSSDAQSHQLKPKIPLPKPKSPLRKPGESRFIPVELDSPRLPLFTPDSKLREPTSTGRKSKSPERKTEAFPVADDIQNIVIIPGPGEFSYNAEVRKALTVTKQSDRQYVTQRTSSNNNNNAGNNDITLGLLKEDLPNVEWVSVVVNWFANNLNIEYCQIYPADESLDDLRVTPAYWQVGQINRGNVRLLLRESDGYLRHHGTVCDTDLIRFVEALRSKGYKVMLHPTVLLDTENKEWRGQLVGPPDSISRFFRSQYNNFIQHYVDIAKLTEVEGFIIGSELEELNKIKDSEGNHPTVSELVKLGKLVKSKLGREVTVTYGANWSEYHSDRGWYYMDELWASESIDVVGIDAYFPLTDGPEPLVGYSIQDIINGWSSGEGWNYFLDYSKSKPEETKYYYNDNRWAWKNIAKWWSEPHVNPDGKQTKWRPKMKKIWFTAYGFASVNSCTNEPYLFVDDNCRGNKYPRYSTKEVSFCSQKVAIEGTLKKWANSEMVEKIFLWAWGVGPVSNVHHVNEIRGASNDWRTGHWIQGKVGKISRAWP